MKKTFVIALLLLVARLQAQVRVGANDAMATAERFMRQDAKQTEFALSLSETIQSEQSGEDNLFVFSAKPQGYVIVSATNEVMAYSLSSNMPLSNDLPDHIAYWLDLYNKQTEYLIQHPDQIKKPEKQQHSVGPLTTSCWGQGCYHNESCPVDSLGPCHHASAGCVAIAMAQILYYHKHPLRGNGETSYYCQPYGTLSANFGETTYGWEMMSNTLHESNPAVAELVYHCGVAVKMNYSAHQSSSDIAIANDALRQHFGYPATILCYRSKYNDEDWQKLIKNNLDKQLPIYYRGVSSSGGHAFVCDGYDNNGLFHFNFGWDGVADGFFNLGDPSGFSTKQTVIHDIQPIDDIPIHSDEHNIIYVSPDGIGDGSSWAEATGDLQGALFKSHSNDCLIWVKEGTYKGNSVDEYAFRMMHNSRIYGGFKGDEPFDYDLSLRDFEAHPTILDGNHRQGVVDVLPYVDSDEIIIDGFTIQNGVSNEGGGILLTSNTTVSNCKICHNLALQNGGGIAAHPNGVGILISNCEFFGNESKNGGAIHDQGSTTFCLCNIHDNVATLYGGGVHNISSISPSVFINCTISHNSALNGGGIHSNQSRTSYWSCLLNNNTAKTGGGCFGESNLFNCTIVKNEGLENYGGVYNKQDTSHEIKNCIIWGNTSQGEFEQIGPVMRHTDCAVQDDTTTGLSNIDLLAENDGEANVCYVRFNNPDVAAGCGGSHGDWRLQSNSPCIGRAGSIPHQPDTDLDGNPRLRHGKVDLGAYESNTASYPIELDFCENAPYYHDSLCLNAPGTYTFLYPSSTYDSLVIIDLTAETIKLQEEICETSTYEFFGETLNEPGHYFALLDCKEYRLDLSVKPLADSLQTIEICEGESYDFHGSLLDEAGHYTDTIGCTLHQLDLTVKTTPVINSEKTICEGESYNFFGTLLRESGQYYHDVICSGHYYLDLTVLPLPSLQCSNDTTVVAGLPAILNASGADAYHWSTGDTTASIIVYPEKDQYYQVTGRLANGCKTTKSIKVNVVEENANDGICLFPNPATDKVNIYKKDIDEVIILNVLGQPVDRMNAQRENLTLDVSHYENGVYIVLVKVLNHRYYTKLIIQH